MKTFLTTLAVLTVFATPAFAQSFCTCDGTGNVLTFTHNPITLPQNTKIAVGRSGLHSFAMVPGPGSSRVPAFDYRRGTSAYPFYPGINFPYPDRPYGDPDHD